MNSSTMLKGTLIAGAVAALFGCGGSAQQQAASPSGEGGASVKCLGINACKGQGSCATAEHSCGKHTPCKGHGWLPVESAEACTAQGGEVI